MADYELYALAKAVVVAMLVFAGELGLWGLWKARKRIWTMVTWRWSRWNAR